MLGAVTLLGQLLQQVSEPPLFSLAFVGGSAFIRALHVAGTPIAAWLITWYWSRSCSSVTRSSRSTNEMQLRGSPGGRVSQA